MKRFFLLVGFLLLALAARAQLTIDITTTGGRQIPIAVVPMSGESAQPQSVSEAAIARARHIAERVTGALGGRGRRD